ncbi:iron-containing redox enzyme family protein [Nonomuraea sp. CA-141351]|uniref:iron-containing redox enzyme family protein n=1 Tax=Nonomuraea sp. CA-141351 TaxID=3239996 RepID=UPI003D8F80BB
MISNSARLRAKIELALPAFHGVTRRLWSSPDLATLYPEYLVLMHTLIRATVPLMETAVRQARQLADGDPVAAGVGAYLAKHIKEERGHDEWLRQDLAALGCDPDDLLRAMPRPSSAVLVGTQYYWVRHHHPVCLLGHIAVLEGYPPHPGLVDHIVERTRFPRTALRTLSRHAALDVRHRDELMATIDALPLTTAHTVAMGVSALHTVQCMVTVFEDLVSRPVAAGAVHG